MTDQNLLASITQLLREIGVPAHLKGYLYLRESVLILYKDYDRFDNVKDLIYKEIANKFKTDASNVERSIRNAIEVTWRRGNAENIYCLFRNTISAEKGKPTNKECMALLVDALKIDGVV